MTQTVTEEVMDLSIMGQIVEEGQDTGRSSVGSTEMPSLQELPEGSEFITDDGVSTPEEPGLRIPASGRSFLIDARDWDLIKDYRWYVQSDGGNRLYVSSTIKGKTTYLHRILMRAKEGQCVDHKLGDSLDNRSCNLRIVTHTQNAWNQRKQVRYKGLPCSSPFKGVIYDKETSKWIARICVHGKSKFLGRYLCPRNAAKAYDEAARLWFGEFALTNF